MGHRKFSFTYNASNWLGNAFREEYMGRVNSSEGGSGVIEWRERERE